MKFLNWYLPQIKKLGYTVEIHSGEGEFSRICNVVIGNIKQASHLVIVPYDTPVCTLVERPYYPFEQEKNKKIVFRSMMIQLIFSIILALSALSICYIALRLQTWSDYVLLVIGGLLFGFSFLIGKGISNRNNFNRNNAALCLITQLINEHPEDTAYILLDTSGNSMKGYGLLAQTYGKRLRHQHAIVLDCVGIGEHIAVVSNRTCPKEIQISDWCQNDEQVSDILALCSKVELIARGTREGSSLVVRLTGTYQDKEVDFDQMQEVLRLVKQLIQA